MPKILLNIDEVKHLHATGQAHQLHGVLDTGLLKAAVYGANDGIVTTFAVVAGVAGAGLPPYIILILGIANMLADGLSMGIGDYLGERSERRHLQHQYAIEEWEVKHIPHEEKQELNEYLDSHGIQPEDKKQLIGIITKYPKFWTTLGFIDEMGVAPDFSGGLWKSGAVTFFAFITAGTLPLVPYILGWAGLVFSTEHQFYLSIISTMFALFFVGSLRTFITKGKWWWNGFEVLAIGAIAATAAYVVGAVIEKMV